GEEPARAHPVVEPGARLLHRAGRSRRPLRPGAGPLLVQRRQLRTARPGAGARRSVERRADGDRPGVRAAPGLPDVPDHRSADARRDPELVRGPAGGADTRAGPLARPAGLTLVVLAGWGRTASGAPPRAWSISVADQRTTASRNRTRSAGSRRSIRTRPHRPRRFS